MDNLTIFMLVYFLIAYKHHQIMISVSFIISSHNLMALCQICYEKCYPCIQRLQKHSQMNDIYSLIIFSKKIYTNLQNVIPSFFIKDVLAKM